MAADDRAGRDALRRLVELRGDRESFLDDKSFVAIRTSILRDLVTLPRTPLALKIAFAVFAIASLVATAYGTATITIPYLYAGLVGLVVSGLAYRFSAFSSFISAPP